MTVTFEAETHTYWAESGRVLPSVSHILEASGVREPWRGSSIYAKRGTYVHKATELVDQGDLALDLVVPEWRPFIEAYIKFRRENVVEILGSEEIVCDEAEWYAGTLDRRMVANGVRMVVDLKSGNSADWHMVQAVAYEKPQPERYRCRILYLRKDGTYRLCGSDGEQREASCQWRDALRRYHEMFPWERGEEA